MLVEGKQKERMWGRGAWVWGYYILSCLQDTNVGVQLARPRTTLRLGMEMWAGDTKFGADDMGPKPWTQVDKHARGMTTGLLQVGDL